MGDYKDFSVDQYAMIFVSVHPDNAIYVNAGGYRLTPAEADKLAECLKEAAKEVRSR